MDDGVCSSAELLSRSRAFRILLSAKAVLCAVGIAATVFVLKSKGVKWLVHSNSKALYRFHGFWALEVAVSYLVVFLFEVIRLSLPHDDPCSYTIPATLGITLRVIPVLGVVTQSFTMCAFAVERSVSTIWPLKYEGVKNSHFGMALGVISISTVYAFLLVPVEWDEVQITSTVRTKSNQESYQTLMEVYMTVELFTVLLFVITYVINRKYCKDKGRQAALGWKYQVQENRKLILSLLPCFATHSVLNVLMVSGLYSYNLIYPEFDRISAAFWVEAMSHVQMYALLMPLIIRIRLKRKNKNVVNGHGNASSYFQQMTQEWENHRSWTNRVRNSNVR